MVVKLVNFKCNNCWTRLVVTLLLVLLVIIIAWRSLNYISSARPRYDSSVFAGSAVHLMAGKVLYRDVWDHKPPLVFFINLCALKLGDATINSVRFAERIFAVTAVILLFWLVSAVFGNILLAFITTLFFLFHMYNAVILSGGNFTEEYGAVFLIAGICAAFASHRLKGPKSAVMSFVCGLVLSLAVLTKEPFVFSIIPWFIYLIWLRRDDAKKALTGASLFIAGAAVPVLLFVIYLLANGAMSDYINMIAYSFIYAGKVLEGADSFNLLRNFKTAYEIVAKPLVITQIAACFGFASLFSRSFVKKFYYLPVAVFACFVLSFVATSMGRYFPHYYMQLVPSYILMVATGLVFILELIGRLKIKNAAIILLVLVLALVAFSDRIILAFFTYRMSQPSRRWNGDGLTRFVLTHTTKTDTIWAPSIPFVGLYVETARLSPTKWFAIQKHFFVDTFDSTGEEKLALLKEQLQSNPPRLVVITPWIQPFLESCSLMEWIAENYEVGFESKAEKTGMTPELDVEVWVYER
jgi:4-amino-4-deoxy-L-arabinose transferase-like glycosyltransferase